MGVPLKVQRFDRWNWGEGALTEAKNPSKIRTAGQGKFREQGCLQLRGASAWRVLPGVLGRGRRAVLCGRLRTSWSKRGSQCFKSPRKGLITQDWTWERKCARRREREAGMGSETAVRVLILGDVDLTWAGAVGTGKKWVGEKILPGEGRKISVPTPSPGFIPALFTSLLHFNPPLKLSLWKARLNSAPSMLSPGLACFCLPSISLFAPLLRREGGEELEGSLTLNTVPVEGSAVEGSGEKFAERAAGGAKCQRGE